METTIQKPIFIANETLVFTSSGKYGKVETLFLREIVDHKQVKSILVEFSEKVKVSPQKRTLFSKPVYIDQKDKVPINGNICFERIDSENISFSLPITGGVSTFYMLVDLEPKHRSISARIDSHSEFPFKISFKARIVEMDWK